MRLAFKVQGSVDEPYEVIFEREGDMVFTTCGCAAGRAKQACKHRLDLLSGDLTALASANAAEVACLSDLIAGTVFAEALSRLAEAEAVVEDAKRQAIGARKALARVMHR